MMTEFRDLNPTVAEHTKTIKGLMTREELADLLHISSIALESRRKRGQLPYVKVSHKNFRFDPSAIASHFGLEEEITINEKIPTLMTIKEVAYFLAVTEDTVRGLIKRHAIKTTKISSHSIRIKGSHLKAFIRANSVNVNETEHILGASA